MVINSIELTRKQLLWLRDAFDARASDWSVDNLVQKRYIEDSILRIQLAQSMKDLNYEIHTWG